MLLITIASVVLFALGNRTTQTDTLDVRVISDEADTSLALVTRAAAGGGRSTPDFAPLFRTSGYLHLKEREAAMGRPFTDSEFVAYLESPVFVGQIAELRSALDRVERANMTSASALALAYLPPRTALRARLYLEIKPKPNSFVFRGADSIPSIFLAVQPSDSPEQAKNTLAHELHHIGVESACRDASWSESPRVPPAVGMLLEYLTAFGEGRAMLAAAGGPTIHPHATDPDSIRQRWDRDVGHAGADIAELSQFATAVLDGRIASADSVRQRGNSYFGVQGPWYTVGWLMASTVEKVLGRPALIATLCRPIAFLASYNRASTLLNPRGAMLPLWSSRLIARLSQAASAASGHRP